MKKEIFTSMLDWVESEMLGKPHTKEEQLFIDAILEFAVEYLNFIVLSPVGINSNVISCNNVFLIIFLLTLLSIVVPI